MRFSVILPIYNEVDFIEETLSSIISGNNLTNAEILIIDGMSDDGTREIVTSYIEQNKGINIRLFDNNQKTVPYAMNIGIKNSSGEFIVRMDAHSIFPSGYIDRLLHWMVILNADNVGGVVETIPSGASSCAVAISTSVSSSYGIGNSLFRTIMDGDPLEVDTVPFGCYKRSTLDKIGLYDTDLMRNQDDELNARLKQNKGRVYLIPEIKIKYYARNSFGKLYSMFYQYGYFKPLVNRKLSHPSTLRQFVPLLFSMYLVFGLLVSIIFPSGFSYYIGGILFYFLTSLLMSLYYKKEPLVIINLIIAFFIIHFSYGVGYMKGILDFTILKKNTSKNIEHSR
jgi:glycosyltransferase involved in cell wall biosynthesis